MGAIAIYNDCDTDSTVISNLFIDEYMKDAGEAEIKVYLYLVRMMNAGRSTSIPEMADLWGHTQKEIVRSLKYWESQGVLTLQCDRAGHLMSIHLQDLPPKAHENNDSANVISIEPMLNTAASGRNSAPAEVESFAEASAAAAPAALVPASSPSDITASALAAFSSSDEMQQLLLVVEQYIGKPLSTNDIKTIYYISEDLHFSSDLIDYLVSYCVGREKRDFRYIEKVAVNWASEGITTTKDAKKATSTGTGRARKKSAPKEKSSCGSFGDFQQNNYDFAEIEKQILSN